jgi:hypothetical protein
MAEKMALCQWLIFSVMYVKVSVMTNTNLFIGNIFLAGGCGVAARKLKTAERRLQLWRNEKMKAAIFVASKA